MLKGFFYPFLLCLLIHPGITEAQTFNEQCLQLTVEPGWNLISLPIQPTDNRLSSVFPSALSPAFSYSQVYSSNDSLLKGEGYWLKFPAHETLYVCGTLPRVDSITLNKGWNLLGAPLHQTSTKRLISHPTGTIQSPFFSFSTSQGYSATDTLNPGKAYWVKTSDSTRIIHFSEKFWNGVDLSFTPEIENVGTVFSDSGGVKPLLQLFKERGINLVRVRLWHTPQDVHSSLHEVLSFAQKIRANGLELFLDFHYSDWWADPAHQTKPAAWSALNRTQLAESVYAYTRDVLLALKHQGTMPVIVQLGNEINPGMLWNDGRVGGSFDTNWTCFSSLLKQGISAVREVDSSGTCKVMIHYAGYNGAEWFFNKLLQHQVVYDIIGLSYYPNWHGKNLDTLLNRMNRLEQLFQKDIMIAETAYPWTIQWNDWTNNIIGSAEQVIPEYPPTPDGQKQFMLALKERTRSIQNYRGVGICYWAPEYVAFRGPQATNGSPWENAALFDFTNTATPALYILGD